MLSNKGYTLPEVLAALLVILITLVALIGILTLCVSAHSRHKSTRLAVNAASTKMEELRRLDFGALGDENGASFDVPGLGSNSGQVGYVTVESHEGGNLRKVAVRVSWDYPHGGDVKLQTVFMK